MVEKRKRMTKQKRVIMDILRNTKSHPTAEWIYQEARKVMPNISLGTVYRNLQVLRENGLISELRYGKSFSRFDGNPELHYHFVCEKCHCVSDVEDAFTQMIAEKIAESANKYQKGLISSYRLEFYGICKNCQKH